LLLGYPQRLALIAELIVVRTTAPCGSPAIEILVELGRERNKGKMKPCTEKTDIWRYHEGRAFWIMPTWDFIEKEGNTTANKCVASRIIFVGKTTDRKKLLRQTAPM
jgi:hypothetical protein